MQNRVADPSGEPVLQFTPKEHFCSASVSYSLLVYTFHPVPRTEFLSLWIANADNKLLLIFISTLILWFSVSMKTKDGCSLAGC